MKKWIISLAVLILTVAAAVGAVNFEDFMAADYDVYYVDPDVTDHGAAAAGSLKTVVEAIGTTEKATIRFSRRNSGNTTDYLFETSLDLTTYTNLTFEVENGARISPAAGVVVTVPSRQHMVFGDEQHVFTGAGVVKFAKFSRVTGENFGALGDGTTNDYTAFLNALKAGCTLHGGVHIAINSRKHYIINNGASAGITLDADNLPDSTVVGTDSEHLPTFELVGTGIPTGTTPSGNTPSGYIKFTGTGNGIDLLSNTLKWQGKIRIENLNLVGGTAASRVAAKGICISGGTFNFRNVIRNVNVMYFADDGFSAESFSIYDNIFENILCNYNGGWGFDLKCNEQLFVRPKAMRNGLGGMNLDQVTSVSVIHGSVAHNYGNQIVIGATLANHVDLDVYLEGQYDANVPYTPVDGTGLGMIKLMTCVDINIKLQRSKSGGLAGTTHYEQYIIEFGGSIYGLSVEGHTTIKNTNGDTMSLFGPIGANALYNAKLGRIYHGASCALFADNATALKFDGEIISYVFEATDLADDTADQELYYAGSTWKTSVRPPWPITLIGITVTGREGKALANINVTEATSGYSANFPMAGTIISNIVQYALGTYNIDDSQNFIPKVTIADVDAATLDLVITFHFMRARGRYTHSVP